MLENNPPSKTITMSKAQLIFTVLILGGIGVAVCIKAMILSQRLERLRKE